MIASRETVVVKDRNLLLKPGQNQLGRDKESRAMHPAQTLRCSETTFQTLCHLHSRIFANLCTLQISIKIYI